jgi:hypothetical protein
MQRDILVAFWFLFDEFEIGDEDGDAPSRDSGDGPKPDDAPPHSRGPRVARSS